MKIKPIGPHDYNEVLRIPMHAVFDSEAFAEQLLKHPHYRFVKVEEEPSEVKPETPKEEIHKPKKKKGKK